MTPQEELAWAAGLFEGEGSVILGKRGEKILYHRLCITQTDLDVLEKFHQIVDIGNLVGPFKNGGLGTKIVHRWQAYKWKEISDLAIRFYPMLGNRRQEQILRMLNSPPPRFQSFQIPEDLIS